MTTCQVHEEPKHLSEAGNVNTEVTATANASVKTQIQTETDKGGPAPQVISPKVSRKTTASSNNLEVFNPQTKSSSKEAVKNKLSTFKTLDVISPQKQSIPKRSSLHSLDITKLKSDGPDSATNSTELQVPTFRATYRKRSESFEEVKEDSLKVTGQSDHDSTSILKCY